MWPDCIIYHKIDGRCKLQKSDQDGDYVPMPVVMIDQDSDSDATIVQLSFGDRLGALIDTVKWMWELCKFSVLE